MVSSVRFGWYNYGELIQCSFKIQVIHARSGVPYEIMGLMQGKVVGQSLVIMDSFALPVQGTETRVNAANEANEYMVEYISQSEKVCAFDPSKSEYFLTRETGRKIGTCHWLVSLPSWLWLLAFWYRCQYTDQQPDLSGSICCCCGKVFYRLPNLADVSERLTPIALFLLERWTSEPSAHTPKVTPPQMSSSPSINQFR